MNNKSVPELLRTRSGMAVVLGLVVLASVLLYLPVRKYRFVWDDTLLITQNQLLARSSPLELLGRGFWAGSPARPEGPGLSYYRPLVSLSFWLDLKLAGPDPAWFHVVNLLLNALAAVLVTLVIWELLHSGVWALLGGLLFTAHSSHVESVAFVSGRTDVLLTVFVALAAFGLLRSLRKDNARWWLVVLPSFAAALLCKETALLFPLLVLLGPLLTQQRYRRHYWPPALGTLLIAGAYLGLRAAVVPAPSTATGAGLIPHLTSIANTFGLYVRMFFWPFEHHAKFPANPAFLSPTSNVLIALLFVVTVPLVSLQRRFWVVLWGYAWAVLFLLPVAGFLSIGPQAAERLLYLPSAGIVMVLVTLGSRLFGSHGELRAAVATLIAVAIVATGVDSARRSRVWHDEPALYGAMTIEAPKAPSAYANLAGAIAAANPDSAVKLYNRAIALDQGYVDAHIDIAMLYSMKADYRRALHHLRLANDLRPNSGQVLGDLAVVFLASGETDSALAAADRALVADPGSAGLHFDRAAVLAAAGRGTEADSELHRSLAIDPGMPSALEMLADRCEQAGRLDSAVALQQRAVDRAPSAAGLNRLGTLYVTAGDSLRGRDCYRRSLARDSLYVPALCNLAALSYASGDTALALSLASRAYRLRPDLEPVKALYLEVGGR